VPVIEFGRPIPPFPAFVELALVPTAVYPPPPPPAPHSKPIPPFLPCPAVPLPPEPAPKIWEPPPPEPPDKPSLRPNAHEAPGLRDG